MNLTTKIPESEINRKVSYRLGRYLLVICLLGVFTLWGGWQFFIYKIHEVQIAVSSTSLEFTIKEGMNARAIARLLNEQQVISSDALFYLMTLFYFDPSNIKAGTYRLQRMTSMYEIADQITRGEVVHDLVTLTHIEGERASAIAIKAAALLPKFNPAEFMNLASTSEGKLYPDTYYVDPDFTALDVYTLLLNTYNKRVEPLRNQIAASILTEIEILTLASIIEREANTEESMKMVAGILQNRLRIGMALQADASIEYVLDKSLQELTPEDLKLDTPYNTYLYPGLPPTPIGNPGLVAIRAVLEPTPSDYYFYITGTDGEFHYAKNFDQHRRNIALYLR